MKKLVNLLVLVIGFSLVACGAAQPVISSNSDTASAKPLPTSTKSLPKSTEAQPTSTKSQPIPTRPEHTPTISPPVSYDLVRTDDQGAVAFIVEPTNLYSPGETLDFEISMNTHSVDLSMDLAKLATLTTDDGKISQGIAWSGAQGGHHVSGTLSFPASIDGKLFLDGSSKLTLTIINVDAPERSFSWDLSK